MPKLLAGMEAPHKVLGRAAIDAIGVAQDAGASASSVLDTPLDMVGAPEGPHVMLHNALNWAADTAKQTIRRITGA